MIFFCCVLGVIPDLKETPKHAHHVLINYNTEFRAPTSRIPRVINMSVIENLINRVKLIKKKFKPIRDRNFKLKKQKKMFKKTRFPNDTALISEIESILAFKIKKVNEIGEELNSLETFLSHFHRIVPLQLTDLEWFKLRKQKRLKIIAHCIGLEKTILELINKTNILLEKTKSEKSKKYLQKILSRLLFEKVLINEFYLFFFNYNL